MSMENAEYKAKCVRTESDYIARHEGELVLFTNMPTSFDENGWCLELGNCCTHIEWTQGRRGNIYRQLVRKYEHMQNTDAPIPVKLTYTTTLTFAEIKNDEH